MRTWRSGLLLASAAFLVFSAVYGGRYTKLGKDRDSIGRYSYGASAAEVARQLRERARIDDDRDEIHSIVKVVSIVYFVTCLGFFVAAWRVSPRRKLAILGAVACVVMTLWSLLVDDGISFDEVYPAWIVAAIVFGALQLAMLERPDTPAAQKPAA
jgi:hypothetical protein